VNPLSSLRANSIFIRVYLHMLLAMLAVIVLAVGATSFINHVRVEQYREELTSGTFYLLSRGWQQQREDSRDAWLAKAGAKLNIKLGLVAVDDELLTRWQLRRLAENRVLLLQGRSEHELIAYRYLDPDKKLLIKGVIPRLSEQHSRVSVELLSQVILGSDRPAIQVLTEVRPRFFYPITLVDRSSVVIDRVERQQLAEGKGVLSFLASGRAVVAYAHFDDEHLLKIGPVAMFDPYPMLLMAGIALVALLLSGSGVYLSVRMLEHRLKKLEQAASRIAAGHLSTRVRVDGDDFVARLAGAFNVMAKQVQELLRTQQEMIHAVSHELRTPVARIRFGMQMIEDMVDDPFAQKQLKGIDSDIQELDELVDEILTYARLGQETLSLHYERSQLIVLLDEVVDGLRVLKPELELSVVHLNPDAGDDADVEVRYFQRAVQNLVSNACRYAATRVQVSCYVDPDSIRIDVDDDGPGIPEEDWDRVFTPFSRLDDSRTRASGGYGLGLSIVRRITYWHQGSALVDRSDEFGGACFSLIFPRFRVDAEETSIVDNRI